MSDQKEERGFPLNRIEEISARPQDFHLLERIPLTIPKVMDHLPIKLAEPEPGEKLHQIVILDTETTGMFADKDRIIELGLVKATYSFTRRRILSVDRLYDEFEDPQFHIPEAITSITNITDDMVKNHQLDDDMVAQIMTGRPLVIAHNASFDRPFFDKRFPQLAGLSWACSQKEIDWDSFGSGGRKLEFLNMSRGWFYNAHRAYVDCLATLWLLHIEPTAFKMLIESAISPSFKVIAEGNTFDIKDALKQQGYRFESKGAEKYWYLSCSTQEKADKALENLQDVMHATGRIETVTAKERYKNSIRKS